MSVEEQKQQLMKKISLAMFQVLVIFGVPALLAFFIGRSIDGSTGNGPKATLIAFAIAFVFSWALVIRMYRKLDAERKEIEMKEKEQDTKPN